MPETTGTLRRAREALRFLEERDGCELEVADLNQFLTILRSKAGDVAVELA